MATTQDASIGFAVEAGSYKTFVTPVRFPEFVDENLGWTPNDVQGTGLRVGGRVARSARLTQPTADGSGDFTMEATSKGMGLLLQACFGSAVSNLVSGSTFQQLFTLGDTPNSLTIQKGVVQADTGTVDQINFKGCMVDMFELAFGNAGLVTLKPTFDIGDIDTSNAYAAPSYPSAPNLFNFAGWSLQTGALTAPTTTALGSGAGVLAGVRGGSIQVNNNLQKGRFNGNGAGRKSKPLVGLREITGSLDIEYTGTTIRDAVIARTPINLVLNWTAGALSTGLEQLQIIVPEIKFLDELPKTNGTELIVQATKFAGLDNLTAAQPIWGVMRTADAAL